MKPNQIDIDAATRDRVHAGAESERILSENHNRVGLAGEYAFAKLVGQQSKTWNNAMGDKGVDFTVNDITVDIKTARKPYFLLLNSEKKAFADIIVLYGYDNTTETATPVGWEWSRIVIKAPIRAFDEDKELLTHHIHSSQLRGMGELMVVLNIIPPQ